MSPQMTTQEVENPQPLIAVDRARLFNQSQSKTLVILIAFGGTIYGLLTIGHYLILPPEIRWKMLSICIPTAAILWGFFLWNILWPIPEKWSQALEGLIFQFLVLNSAAHLGFSAEMKQSSNLALLVLGSGCIFLSYPWWLFSIASCVIAWITVVQQTVGQPDWAHYGFMFLICFAMSFMVIEARRRVVLRADYDQRVDKIRMDMLEKALEEIRTLEGLIPICAWCKKVRDDEGFWSDVESFVGTRTEAEFSHSLCPTCKKVHFDDHE